MTDPTALLTPIFGAYAASVISFLAFVAYVITWIAPLIPPPGTDASPWWKFVYAVINKVGANVGHARNVAPIAPEPVPGQFAQSGVNTAPPVKG